MQLDPFVAHLVGPSFVDVAFNVGIGVTIVVIYYLVLRYYVARNGHSRRS